MAALAGRWLLARLVPAAARCALPAAPLARAQLSPVVSLSWAAPARGFRSGVTKSSVKKRIRLKKGGAILRHCANKRHLNMHKSSARLNRLSGWSAISTPGFRRKYREMLLIGGGNKR